MRLRRLELIFISVTLAFVVFMGGFFAGRSWSSVNIEPVTASVAISNDEGGFFVQQQRQPQQEENISTAAHANGASSNTSGNYTNPQADTSTEPQTNPETATQPEAGTPRGGDGKININIATQSELTDLPGIGNTLASRIVAYRRQHGDFLRIEDIRNVSGIGEKRYEAIEHMITV